MAQRETKALKQIVTKYADYVETITPYAVYENNVRIGTVLEFAGADCPIYFDPMRGTNGHRKFGKAVIVDYHIQRKCSLAEAVAAI